MTGGVVSLTVTWNVAVAVFPAASLAVQLTVVVPSGNSEPDAGVQLTATGPSTLSVAVTVYPTCAPPGSVASAVMSAGTVITGGVVSASRVTVTVNVSGLLLPR